MQKDFSYPINFIRYLGTAGARFSMMRQTRYTGGIWFTYGGLSGVIDPGPGSLCHICDASPALDPHDIRSILLTHRHIDHSTDVNVLAEAMTGGGFEKQGSVVLPADAFNGPDPVLTGYFAQKVENVYLPEDGKAIELDCGVSVEPVAHIHHGVSCFGWIFRKKGFITWGIISDTKPLEYLADRYSDCSYISINAPFPDKKPKLDHMSLEDVGELLNKLHPKLATITHMGVFLLESGPEKYMDSIATEQTRAVAGQDGMVINLDSLDIFVPVQKPKENTEYRPI